MAKLLDLPDEILTLILAYFEAVQQSPYLLRAAEAKNGAAGRAKLLLLARICKRLHPIATALLQRNQWLCIDLTSDYENSPTCPRVHLTDLARLTACKDLRHMVCSLDPGSVGLFLACISNIASLSGMRSLSIVIDYESEFDRVDSIHLENLSCLPQLVGLEFNMCDYSYNWHGIEIGRSGPIGLKELECGVNTIHQLERLLSLASPEALESLYIRWDLENDYHEGLDTMVDIWPTNWQDKPMQETARLFIVCGPGSDVDFPSESLAAIPNYFPSLLSCEINYEVGISSERYLTILSDHSMCTSLTISPGTAKDLELALRSILESLEHRGRLQKVRIGKGSITTEEYGSVPEPAQLWSEAYAAARSCGLHISPEKLVMPVKKKLKI